MFIISPVVIGPCAFICPELKEFCFAYKSVCFQDPDDLERILWRAIELIG
jgi:hypothetical protein